MPTALDGLKVLDLSRILAGPTCTQLLGDLGADVIKIENPRTKGDDTRTWGPPFVQDQDGNPTDLSAYFNCANRNKRSIAVDIATTEGQQIIRTLASKADVVVENFKPGGLAKYGLDHLNLRAAHPRLIYCSISGFGQTGPNAHKPGYDLMAQGFGGIMSLTGEPDSQPMKVGVGIADVMCGMYATTGILAALNYRNRTGIGQHIDVALVDSQIAWLINEGTNYLTSGELPLRRGNGHPNIAPYQVYETSDGYVIIAVGNDRQFGAFCKALDLAEPPDDPRFATNPARLAHRDALNAILEPALRMRPTQWTTDALEAAGIPVGPVNTLDKVFDSDQVAARAMQTSLASEVTGASVPIIGNPLKLSATPVEYRRAPPVFGEHTEEVLRELEK
ncbi:MAG: CoA transferase [Rhodobacteraceae bacterium]|nr:CoA transferase [Paracoccaceae bacterium]